MRDDNMLYKWMDEINNSEADVLENSFNEISAETAFNEENLLKKQEELTMNKIRAELEKETQATAKHKTFTRFSRKKFVVLAAAAVMMFSMVAFARENDWDIEMAEMLGLSGAMEELDGGYVKLDVADRDDGITVTAAQAIGDQNFQWIQVDTDVSWNVGEEGYYMFEEVEFDFRKKNGEFLEGGTTFYSYNNNGMVSFMLHAEGVQKVNRAKVNIKLGKLYRYESRDAEGVLVSDGAWELSWRNYYASNTITKYPLKLKDGLLIRKIEISPVSMHAEAVKTRSKELDCITIEQITLEDGTVIACRDVSSGNSNNVLLDNFVVYENWESVDLEEIKSVTINGVEVEVR